MTGILSLIEPGAVTAAKAVDKALGLDQDPEKIDVINGDCALISIAISLKRIADGLNDAPELIRLAIYNGITDGLHAASLKR